jgi:hypothetical protein
MAGEIGSGGRNWNAEVLGQDSFEDARSDRNCRLGVRRPSKLVL